MSIEQTATAPQGATPSTKIDAGTVLDHYVVERELGSGGMGVVYQVFDTELQRRVALKVLRDGLTDQAQQRLLREARAMARLAHANVVTVYEVGSANGRDFVAMELVEGEPLADWLRATKRSEQEILDAFISAGRGLAAAHAAGMVHRDFKPHNILRSRGGRVVVTDFGLARDAADPLTTTLPVPATTGVATESALSGLTVPGTLVGTPAYMAPEQWSGGRLTPATDQFSFCIALWEALTGERPYRGDTLEALRDQVDAGPDALDASKLPRRFRALLRRGLATDPAARWPSMDALLARLHRRTPRVAIIAAAGAAVLAVGTVIVVSRNSDDKPTCRAPKLALPTVQATYAWHDARGKACDAPVAVREAQLACLDLVGARIDANLRAQALSTVAIEPLQVQPARCTLGPIALPAHYSEEAVAALALAVNGAIAPDLVDRTRTAARTDVCVAAYLALADGRDDDAARDLATCGDDLARAHLALHRFERDVSGMAKPELDKRTREVEQLIDIATPSLTWRIDAAKAGAAKQQRNYDEAFAAFDAAISHAPDERRMLPLVTQKLEALLERSRRFDVEMVREQVAKWQPIAERIRDAYIVEQLAWIDATAQWTLGDVEGGGKRLRELHAKFPISIPGGERMTGVVVDTRGAPVAGATVATGFGLIGDAVSIATPFYGANGMFRMIDITTTTTDADGRFVLENAPTCYGSLVAQHGTERSTVVEPREGVRLVVQPTTHVRGRVDLAGRIGMFAVSVSHARASISNASVMAMVGPDGRFSVEGVVPGDMIIGLSQGPRNINGHSSTRHIRVGPRGVDDLVLEVPAGRELRILVRGAEMISSAPVFIVGGTITPKTMNELVNSFGAHQLATAIPAAVSEPPPPELAGQYKPGDLLATPASAPTGPATACAIRRFARCGDPMNVTCVPVPANAVLITLDVKGR